MSHDGRFALTVIDASGKQASGIYGGNTLWLGSFSQCKQQRNAHYCLVIFPGEINLMQNKPEVWKYSMFMFLVKGMRNEPFIIKAASTQQSVAKSNILWEDLAYFLTFTEKPTNAWYTFWCLTMLPKMTNVLNVNIVSIIIL